MASWRVNVPASIEHRRVVLESGFREAFDDYFVPAALLAGVTFFFLFANPRESSDISSTVVTSLLLIAGLGYWIYSSHRSYRLVRLDVRGSQEELRERVLDAVEEVGWAVVEDEDDLIVAYTRPGLSPGQIVTIIPVPNALYVGSRNRKGRKGKIPFSFGRNAENIQELREALGIEGGVERREVG